MAHVRLFRCFAGRRQLHMEMFFQRWAGLMVTTLADLGG